METNTFFALRRNQILGSIVLIMTAIALTSYASLTFKQSEYVYGAPATISVIGEGEVVAIPDIGQFSFSVTASGTDAILAREAANKNTNAIISFLKEKGVEEKDIKTDNYNLYPKYRYVEGNCVDRFGYCPGEQVADGFELNQSISVKVRNLDLAGELVAGVGDFGATNISNLQFMIDDNSTIKAEARAAAIADAKAKAKILAKDLDVRLVKMISYYEDQGYPEPYYSAQSDMMMKVSEAAVVPELPVGENTTKTKVTITYEVK